VQVIYEFLTQKWEVLFSGAGVAVIVGVVAWLKKTKPELEDQSDNFTGYESSEKKILEGIQTVVGNGKDLSHYKDTTRILFIDDDKDFKVVKILKTAGWQHTSLIKDVKDLDQKEIVEADILFVDIQGVGVQLGFADEGLGVAQAIKERNPSKKVVIYSAQTHGERLHNALSMADSLLKKNADPYEFIQLVESFTVGN
jgi:hypothetical protein